MKRHVIISTMFITLTLLYLRCGMGAFSDDDVLDKNPYYRLYEEDVAFFEPMKHDTCIETRCYVSTVQRFPVGNAVIFTRSGDKPVEIFFPEDKRPFRHVPLEYYVNSTVCDLDGDGCSELLLFGGHMIRCIHAQKRRPISRNLEDVIESNLLFIRQDTKSSAALLITGDYPVNTKQIAYTWHQKVGFARAGVTAE